MTENSVSQEAVTGIAKWQDRNPAVVEQFLRYLCILDYDDTKIPASKDPFFDEPPPATDAGSETSHPENVSFAQGSTERTSRSEEARNDYHATADDQQVARHHRLIINMDVYAMADMYQIPALVQLGQFKFEMCAVTWPHGAFPAIIQRMLILTGPDDKGLRRLCAKIRAERLYEIVLVRAEIGDLDRWADVILGNRNFAIAVWQQAAHRLSDMFSSNAALRAQVADMHLRARIGEDLLGHMSEAWRAKGCYCPRCSRTNQHELVGSFATGNLGARCKRCGFLHPIQYFLGLGHWKPPAPPN